MAVTTQTMYFVKKLQIHSHLLAIWTFPNFTNHDEFHFTRSKIDWLSSFLRKLANQVWIFHFVYVNRCFRQRPFRYGNRVPVKRLAIRQINNSVWNWTANNSGWVIPRRIKLVFGPHKRHMGSIFVLHKQLSNLHPCGDTWPLDPRGTKWGTPRGQYFGSNYARKYDQTQIRHSCQFSRRLYEEHTDIHTGKLSSSW